jgi:hypothetical protein
MYASWTLPGFQFAAFFSEMSVFYYGLKWSGNSFDRFLEVASNFKHDQSAKVVIKVECSGKRLMVCWKI